jgi:hypothetical protein
LTDTLAGIGLNSLTVKTDFIRGGRRTGRRNAGSTEEGSLMSARGLLNALVAAAVIGSVGCASTTVVSNPGPDDCGFRYYRMKPYLLVQANSGQHTNPGTYTLSIQALPDYTEEYSIHIHPGFGINNTAINFDDAGYGTLKSVNMQLDSGTSGLVNAFAGLLGTTPNLVRGLDGGGSSNLTEQRTVPVHKTDVLGHNVPVGYYEAVVSRGPDGVKRMYGWRYLGFAPFSPCPLDLTGVGCMPCTEADLFGLVTVGDRMYFRRLSELVKEVVHGEVTQTKQTTEGPGTTPGHNPDAKPTPPVRPTVPPPPPPVKKKKKKAETERKEPVAPVERIDRIPEAEKWDATAREIPPRIVEVRSAGARGPISGPLVPALPDGR